MWTPCGLGSEIFRVCEDSSNLHLAQSKWPLGRQGVMLGDNEGSQLKRLQHHDQTVRRKSALEFS